MKSVQRKFGKVMKRGDNEADVQTVLAEFKAVDEMLDRVGINMISAIPHNKLTIVNS